MGIDPLWYYNPDIPEAHLDASVHSLINDGDKKMWSREDLKELFRSQRKTQGLGRPALETLKQIGSNAIEESIATISEISKASDGTTKLLVKLLQDGLEVESVIIPWEERGRSTICISSQVGCAQGCKFCATGRMGRMRNLSADEICAQVYLARKVCRVMALLPVDGVVFMGMGEPA
jgi:adenine C2-methylase RlmN of 23S rRNA A2503 and tRNA A37